MKALPIARTRFCIMQVQDPLALEAEFEERLAAWQAWAKASISEVLKEKGSNSSWIVLLKQFFDAIPEINERGPEGDSLMDVHKK